MRRHRLEVEQSQVGEVAGVWGLTRARRGEKE